MARYAKENRSFYRELYRGLDPADFFSLPIIDKSAYMENFDGLVGDGLSRERLMAFALENERARSFLRLYRGRYSVGLSTGTSGNKGLTVTPLDLVRRMPFVFLARFRLPLRLLPVRAVFLLRVHSPAFQAIDSPLFSLRYASTMERPQNIAAMIAEERANLLMAPPSLLRTLLPFAASLRRTVRLVASFAEVLYPDDRERIERSLACPVAEIYQTTEGPIATPCRKGTLHINEDLLYVELRDADDRLIREPGRLGSSLVVTNLYNRLHPLVRYRMNDMVSLGRPCGCGSAFRTIERIVGRSDDVFRFRGRGGELRTRFPALASRWIVAESDDILDFQARQDSIDGMELRLIVRDGIDAGPIFARIAARFSTELALYGCERFEIRPSPLAPERRDGCGKYKRFIAE